MDFQNTEIAYKLKSNRQLLKTLFIFRLISNSVLVSICTKIITWSLRFNLPISEILDKTEPDFIFYLSGVDVLKNDKLGRLSMSIEGCKERDKYIIETCYNNSIPIQISMGGGYSSILKDIIEAHSNTFRLAQEIYF